MNLVFRQTNSGSQNNPFEGQQITIYLRLWNGKGIKIQKSLNSNLQGIKILVVQQFQIPYSQIIIVFRGLQLPNDQLTLKKAGITQKSIIHIMRKENKEVINVEVVFAQKKIRQRISIASHQIILNLKKKIQNMSQLPFENQVLIYCGGELQNNKQVSSYNFNTGSSIFLLDKRAKILQGRKQWFQGQQLPAGMKITNSIQFSDNKQQIENKPKFKTFKEVVSVVESELVQSQCTDQIQEIRQLQTIKKEQQKERDKMSRSVRMKPKEVINKNNLFKSTIQNRSKHEQIQDSNKKFYDIIEKIEQISIYEQQIKNQSQIKQNKELQQQPNLQIIFTQSSGVTITDTICKNDTIYEITQKLKINHNFIDRELFLKNNGQQLKADQIVKDLNWKNNQVIDLQVI